MINQRFAFQIVLFVMHTKKGFFSADTIDPLQLVGPTPSIIVPVSFTKGFVTYSNPNVTSGFLQLRAFDKKGASYAMCPGVRYFCYIVSFDILRV